MAKDPSKQSEEAEKDQGKKEHTGKIGPVDTGHAGYDCFTDNRAGSVIDVSRDGGICAKNRNDQITQKNHLLFIMRTLRRDQVTSGGWTAEILPLRGSAEKRDI